MKKIFFSLLLLIGAISANAQTVKVYKASTMVYSSSDADSVVFRQTTAPVDESTYAFSVSKRRQVVFSPGNLQYTQSTNTWAFAEHQYDIIGEANIIGGALADKIDLFGWSASNTTAPFGVSLSKDNADYAGDFVDWGTNTIGTDAPNTWRTLTSNEWQYLIGSRTNAAQLMGVAHIQLSADGTEYMNGLILLPDSWVCPEGVTFKSGTAGIYGKDVYAEYQTIVLADWQRMEAAGAVFLPAAGDRYGLKIDEIAEYGGYWLATPHAYHSGFVMSLEFDSEEIYADSDNSRGSGLSVRLVKDFGEPAMPSGKFSVAAGKQITFSGGNLQYTQSTNTWAFADNQYDIIGKANTSEGALADQIDLFGWSSTNTATPFGVSISDTDADYKGAFVDWGTNTIGSDAPNTWRTLTKDEWDYLFRTRPNADKRNGIARIYLSEDKAQYADGLILLPDDWTCPEGVTFKEGGASGDNPYADHQTFTLAQWQALEEAQAVFLPAAGARYGATVGDIMDYGFYWSATAEETEDEELLRAYTFYVEPDNIMSDVYDRKSGQSVRLVRDVQAPAAGSPAHTSAESTEEITTQVVTVYQPGGKVSRFNDVDSVVFVETPAVALSGKFFVGGDKYVTFSPGNLQYIRSTDTWTFAKHQYDLIGEANIIDDNLADKIDLFGWSANNKMAPFGISTARYEGDYLGNFVDWGSNTIDGYTPNTWRTLTSSEWGRIIFNRYNPSGESKLIGVARIAIDGSASVNGLVLLPDDWTCPEGITFKSGFAAEEGDEQSYGDYQTISLADWQKMEAAGAVFLPAAGFRDGSAVTSSNRLGCYWSATPYDPKVLTLLFDWWHSNPNYQDYRNYGQSVRLVKDM